MSKIYYCNALLGSSYEAMDKIEENNNVFGLNRRNTSTIDDKNLNELLCCSDNFYSIKQNEQLSTEEVKDLWLRITKNL